MLDDELLPQRLKSGGVAAVQQLLEDKSIHGRHRRRRQGPQTVKAPLAIHRSIRCHVPAERATAKLCPRRAEVEAQGLALAAAASREQRRPLRNKKAIGILRVRAVAREEADAFSVWLQAGGNMEEPHADDVAQPKGRSAVELAASWSDKLASRADSKGVVVEGSQRRSWWQQS